MKAVYLTKHGGVENLKYVEDAPKPPVNENEVLVNIKATSVNRADIVVRNGYPGLNIPLPHILGGDITGVVEDMGPGVKDFAPGDRVIALPLITYDRTPETIGGFHKKEHSHLSLDWKYYGMHIPGSYAGYAAVPESNLVKIPENINFPEATSLGVAGLTAWHAINGVGKLAEGEVFMIWGGSGGLGTIAVQLAKAAGATVIATVGSDDKKGLVESLGADYIFNHNTDDVADEVRKLFRFGVDMILDYVGPATFPKSFDLLKKGGRMLLCGILTGRETTLSIHMTYLRHLSIHGLYLGTKDELEALVKMAGEGQIKPQVYTSFSLKDAAEAHKLLESGGYTGKIVLLP